MFYFTQKANLFNNASFIIQTAGLARWASPGNLLEMEPVSFRGSEPDLLDQEGACGLCSSRVPHAPQDVGPVLWSQASSVGPCAVLQDSAAVPVWTHGFLVQRVQPCLPPPPCSGCGNAMSPEEQCSLLLKGSLGGLWAALGPSSHHRRQRPYLEIRSLQV